METFEKTAHGSRVLTKGVLNTSCTHERNWTATEQNDATNRRINEGGDSVPSRQDSVTRRD